MAPQHPLVVNFYEHYYRETQDWLHLSTVLEQKFQKATGDPQIAIALELADIAQHQLKNDDKAIMALSRVLSLAPDNAEIQDRLADLYQRTGRWHAFLEVLHRTIDGLSLDRTDEKVDLYFKVIEVYQDPAKLPIEEMVINTFNKIVELSPTNLTALDSLAQKYEDKARWRELVHVLQKKVEATDDADVLIELFHKIAELWIERIHNPAQAIPALQELLRLDPSNLAVVRQLRKIYKSKHDLTRLYETYLAELALVEGDGAQEEILFELAVLATEHLGRPNEALEHWRRLFHLKPENDRAFDALIQLLRSRGEYDELTTVYRTRIDGAHSRKRKLELYEQLANELERANEHERTEAIYRELLEIEPDHPRARSTLVQASVKRQDWPEIEALYESRGDYQGLAKLIDEVQSRESELERRIELNKKLVTVYETKLHQKDRAAAVQERIWRLDPDNRDELVTLIGYYQETAQWASLMDAQEALLQHAESDEEQRKLSLDNMSLAEEKLGDPKSAFHWCARVFAYDIAHGDLRIVDDLERLAAESDSWLDLLIVYRDVLDEVADEQARVRLMFRIAEMAANQVGDMEEASRYYREVVALDPYHVEALQALENLYAGAQDVQALEQILSRKLALDLPVDERRACLEQLGNIYENIIYDSTKAIEAYEAMIDIDPSDRLAIDGLKRAFAVSEEWEKLFGIHQHELRYVAGDELLDLKFEMGLLVQERLGDIPRAVEIFKDVLNVKPDHEGALGTMESLLSNPDVEQGVAAFLERFYRDADDAEKLAIVLEVELRYSADRLRTLELLRELERLYGERLERRGHAFDKQLARFRVEADDEELWNSLLDNARGLQRLPEVVRAFRQATGLISEPDGGEFLEDDHRRKQLLVVLARLQMDELFDPEEALRTFDAAHDLDPQDLNVLMQLELLLRTLDRFEELFETEQKRLDLTWDPEEKVPLLLSLCTLLEDELQRPTESEPFYVQILAIDPANLAAYDALERMYRESERYAETVELLQRRLSFTEDAAAQSDLHFALAVLHRDQLNNVDEAVREFGAVLATDPTHEATVAALEALLRRRELPHYDLLADEIVRLVQPVYDEQDEPLKLAWLFEDVLYYLAEQRGSDFDQFTLLRDIGLLYETRLDNLEQAFAYYTRALAFPVHDKECVEKVIAIGSTLEAWDSLVAALEPAIEPHETQYLCEIAEIYQNRLEKPERAIELYERALDSDPTATIALTALEWLHLERRDDEKLIEIWRKKALAQEDPAQRRAVVHQTAIKLAELERNDEAIEAYRELLDVADPHENPSYEPALSALIPLYEAAGDKERVASCHMDLVELQASDAEKVVHLLAAGMIEEHDLHDVERAIGLYDRVRSIDARNEIALGALERLYRETARWEDLYNLLDQGRSFVEDPESRWALACDMAKVARDELLDIDRAIALYEQVLTENPQYGPALAALDELGNDIRTRHIVLPLLERAYATQGNFAELLAIKQRMLDAADDPEERVQILLALAELQTGALSAEADAFETYRKVLELRPDSSEFVERLFGLAEQLGRLEEFSQTLVQCASRADDVNDRRRLNSTAAATERDRLQNPRRAAELLEEVRLDFASDLDLLDELEALYEVTGDDEKLLDVLRSKSQFAESDEGKITALFKSALVLKTRLERPQDARAPLREALAIDPAQLECYDLLAEILEGDNEWDELLVLLQQKEQQLTAESGLFETLFEEVEILVRQLQRPYEVLPILRRVLERMPGEPRAIGWLEEMLAQGGSVIELGELLEPHYQGIEEWAKLSELYARYSDEIEDPRQQADYLERQAILDEERLANPEGAFEARLRQVPLVAHGSDLHQKLWVLARTLGGFDRVVERYEQTLATGPESEYAIDLHRMLGYIHRIELAQPARAIDHYRLVLDFNPRDEAAQSELLELYVQLNRWEELVGLYEQLVDGTDDAEEKRSHLMQIAAISGAKLKRLDEAGNAFQRVLEIAPMDYEAFKGLEYVLTQGEQWPELVGLFEHRLEHVDDRLARAQLLLQKARTIAEKTDYPSDAIELFAELVSNEIVSRDSIAALEALLARLNSGDNPDSSAVLRCTEILGACYEPQRGFRRLLDIYQIELAHRSDVASQIELHRKMVELYQDYARDQQSAFQHLREAALLDFSNPERIAELEEHAEKHRMWEGLIDSFKRGAETLDNPVLQEEIWIKVAKIFEERMRRYDQADIYYRKVLDLNPGHIEALEALEKFARREYRFEDLTTLLETKATYIDSEDARVETLKELAELYQKKFNDTPRAVDTFKRVLEIRPTETATLKNLEKLFKIANDHLSLVELYEHQATHSESDEQRFELLLQCAVIEEESLEDAARAIDSLRRADQLRPDEPRVLDALERLYDEVSDWEGLLETLERKTTRANEFQLEELRLRMGQVLLQQLNQPERAFETFRSILERNPSHQKTIREIESLLENPALRFQAAITLEPIYEGKRQSRNLASVLAIQLDHIADLEERVALLLRVAGLHEQALRQPEEAYNYLSQAFLLRPTDENVRRDLEQQTQRLGAWARLSETFERAMGMLSDPDQARDLHKRLAEIYETQLRDDDKAILHYQTMLGFDEFNRDALAALARLYEKRQDWRDLAMILGKQLEVAASEDVIDIKYRLATVYLERLDQPHDALELYKQVLRERSDHLNTLQRLEQLAQNADYLTSAAQFLEPFYQQNKNWTRLVWLLSLMINRMEDKAQRANAFIKLAEINDKYLSNKREAFNAYLDAVEEDPTRVAVLDELEGLAQRLNIWDELVESVDRLRGRVEGQPVFPVYLSRLGNWYLHKLHDFGAAEKQFTELLQLSGDAPDAMIALEDIYKRTNKVDSLLEIYERKASGVLEVREKKALFYQIAQLARELGDAEKAISFYENILGIDSTERPALDNLEKIHESGSDYEHLAAVLERKSDVATDVAEHVAIKLKLADVRWHKLGLIQPAIEAFEEVMSLDKGNRSAISALRDLYQQTEDWPKFQWITQSELEITSQSSARVALLYRLAELTEQRLSDARGAVPHLRAILEIAPDEEDALDELIRLYEKTEQWPELIATYGDKVDGCESLEDRFAFWLRIADVYSSKLHDDDKSIETLKLILDRNPRHINALGIMATIHEHHGDWAQAAETLESILAIAPEHELAASRYKQLAEIYRNNLENIDRAEACYLRVCVLMPDDHGAFEALAGIYRERGEWSKLLERMEERVERAETPEHKVEMLLEMATISRERLDNAARFIEYGEWLLDIDPNRPELVETLVAAHLDRNDLPRAAHHLEWLVDYLRNNRKFKELHGTAHQLGGVYEQLGEKDQAIKFYKIANEQLANVNSPSYLANLVSLGRLLCEQEQWADALKIYQTMLLQQTRIKEPEIKVELFFNLGRIMLQQGETRRAKEYFSRVLSVDRNHEAAKAILESLGR
ncbi:MAG: tetratricopeptide repeat protein [Myxococcales bacterium]|nr:tetratricopeptide repeat protein [Myxococcales bacterium]